MRRTSILLAALGLSCGAARAVSLIQLEFSGSMSDLQRRTFIDAADFWNSTITGYKLVSDTNGNPTPHSLKITASVAAIDGAGGVLGSAGPQTADYYDNDPLTPHPTMALYYTRTGEMTFDSADADRMAAGNTLYGAVLHEMAHVLGIGTLWTFNNNVNGTTYPLYTTGSGQYTGPHALAQYRTEFLQPGATYVPVELDGGSGTANGHWNESLFGIANTGIASVNNGLDFKYELMTGWSSDPFFLSRTTLGAIEDLGYLVDYSKAGIIDHVVTVPECGGFLLAAITVPPLLLRRRRM